ncbi:UvrD-helicase domain-containing protein [Candidatus Coxiella mudrowiae]|uniref:UvrD-helicase domain-containing protein n=1 Tax=Candidatus Coxiella mudrowiae TaxID=2054173 RepID=UPI000C28764B|nr:UvrD-helicase domain-containing protein [Candidatus Coxiella mudrowiae]
MSDQAIRQQALDPTQSYIVQAPAGSGKTELLIQRFLKLLSASSMPEEIVAITFTRKAAIEMRERILKALNEAKNQPRPKDDHKALTWMLAKTVVERNKLFHWQLEINANRLRILTIDALAHQICLQMPILTGFGAPPVTREDDEIEVFYRCAIEKLLMSQNYTRILEPLLLHLDNKVDLLEKLLIKMLSHREQWIGHIIDYYSNPDLLKKKLEKALEFIALDAMQKAHDLIDNTLANQPLANQLIPLIQFSSVNIQQIKPGDAISACAPPLTELPKINIQNLSAWKGIANLLLTQRGEWRKRIDKSVGFPSDARYKQQKLQMQNLLEQFQSNNPLRMALQEIQNCPPINYTQNQWRILKSLISLLPLLVAQLQVIFKDHNIVDFTEVSLGALRALGNIDQPSDYALQLDTQIHHLLIDEFQDTSIIQFRLIEALIAGWQPNDGRTIFLVGDPMQSIYRFRQAEVGLFLQVEDQGIGNIRLIPLILCNNFRSQKTLIEWFNFVFKHLFPTEANSWLGSIPYSPSQATNENFPGKKAEVNFHSLASYEEETQKIIEIIQTHRTQNDNTTIALLVRSRSHLLEIIPALRNASIPFNAVEIEELGYRTEIIDLLSLTRALHHLGDRIAWLAILRAPWCGLTLQDIHRLCLHSRNEPLWLTLQKKETLKDLTFDGKKRLERITPILSYALHNRDRLPLAIWIETVWIALGGPACLNSPSELVSVRAYFNLLESIENEFTIKRLIKKLRQLYAPIDNPNPQAIQIMTIHKAKGLEFDHVIVPSLERTPKAKENFLLQWLERPLPTGISDLILAPLKAATEKSDPLYVYLKQIEKKKSDNEIVRLFYVAATRAKIGLHFLLILKREKASSIITSPPNGSFANLLWDVCEEEIKKSISLYKETKPLESKQRKCLYRLSSKWTTPILFITPSYPSTTKLLSPSPLQDQFQRTVGTVIHQLLEKISIEGVESWDEKRIINSKSFIKRRLLQLGILFSKLNSSVTLIEKAIRLTLSHQKGRWILSPHYQHQSEYCISMMDKNEFIHYVVDRTFIDYQGVRWIIDYKSATRTEPNLSLFLQKQRILYESQLNRYAKAFQLLEDRPIKLGLYFPLCQGWCEWKLNLCDNIL